ncbi:hypothetical protein [Phragmitibacter flavus]|uniref:hypothetical protein n=1 Tax=Phragmitibacter flavus TaxID=2576071 RepID=UPI001F104B61|nr:hypothetical protein [Phragmitibacter flavus]
MFIERRLEGRADRFRRQHPNGFELFVANDFFKALEGDSLVGSVEGNVVDLVLAIKAVSTSIAAANIGFALDGFFGAEDIEGHGLNWLRRSGRLVEIV